MEREVIYGEETFFDNRTNADVGVNFLIEILHKKDSAVVSMTQVKEWNRTDSKKKLTTGAVMPLAFLMVRGMGRVVLFLTSKKKESNVVLTLVRIAKIKNHTFAENPFMRNVLVENVFLDRTCPYFVS